MILKNHFDNDVELHSFEIYSHDDKLKEQYFRWLDDLEVTILISSNDLILPKNYTYIENSFERFTTKNCIGFFIKHNPSDKIVGTAKLDQISYYNRSGWDGIMIGEKDMQGKGIGTKVYKILLSYGFSVIGLHKIMGGCNENNTPMIKIFERLGYKREGIFRKTDYINGEYSDHIIFGIFKDEFNSNKIKIL